MIVTQLLSVGSLLDIENMSLWMLSSCQVKPSPPLLAGDVTQVLKYSNQRVWTRTVSEHTVQSLTVRNFSFTRKPSLKDMKARVSGFGDNDTLPAFLLFHLISPSGHSQSREVTEQLIALVKSSLSPTRGKRQSV